MLEITDSEQYFEDKRKEVRRGCELLYNIFTDIAEHLREMRKHVNNLRAKIKDEDSLVLFEKVECQYVMMQNQYVEALRLILDNNQREFKMMIDIIGCVMDKEK